VPYNDVEGLLRYLKAVPYDSGGVLFSPLNALSFRFVSSFITFEFPVRDTYLYL